MNGQTEELQLRKNKEIFVSGDLEKLLPHNENNSALKLNVLDNSNCLKQLVGVYPEVEKRRYIVGRR